jgi:hypothetical protein
MLGSNLLRDNPMELIAMMRGRGNSTRVHPLKTIITIDSPCLKKPILIDGKNAQNYEPVLTKKKRGHSDSR